jgi:hypothetical protein
MIIRCASVSYLANIRTQVLFFAFLFVPARFIYECIQEKSCHRPWTMADVRQAMEVVLWPDWIDVRQAMEVVFGPHAIQGPIDESITGLFK